MPESGKFEVKYIFDIIIWCSEKRARNKAVSFINIGVSEPEYPALT